jgi:hypothetical protein
MWSILKDAVKPKNLFVFGVGFVAFAAFVEVVSMFAPAAGNFVNRPVASVRGLFGKKA